MDALLWHKWPTTISLIYIKAWDQKSKHGSQTKSSNTHKTYPTSRIVLCGQPNIQWLGNQLPQFDSQSLIECKAYRNAIHMTQCRYNNTQHQFAFQPAPCWRKYFLLLEKVGQEYKKKVTNYHIHESYKFYVVKTYQIDSS